MCVYTAPPPPPHIPTATLSPEVCLHRTQTTAITYNWKYHVAHPLHHSGYHKGGQATLAFPKRQNAWKPLAGNTW